MKSICSISQNIKKILIMLLLVVFLSACGKDSGSDVGNVCIEKGSSQSATCIDTKDVDCIGCRIFKLMFDAVSINVMRLHGQLTTGAMSLMMICFAIWLALRLLKFVSSVKESSISQVWNEIMRQAFLCVFCGVLASSPEMLIYAVNTFVYPIYAAFLRLGISIMETSISDMGTNTTSFKVYGENIIIGETYLFCTFDKTGLITKEGFPKEFLNTIICMIRILKTYLTIGTEISYNLLSQGESFLGWLVGMILFIFFYIVKLGIVFYLVDTIFQMGIIILLLPIFILSYAFKVTRKWTNDCFKNLLASAGFLMCFSIVVTMVLRAMIEIIKNNESIFSPENAEADASNVGLGCLCLLLIGFLIYGSVGVTEKISGALIGAKLDKGFQEKMIKFLDVAKGWVFNTFAAIVSASSSIMPAKVQKIASRVKEVKSKVDRLAGRKKG